MWKLRCVDTNAYGRSACGILSVLRAVMLACHRSATRSDKIAGSRDPHGSSLPLGEDVHRLRQAAVPGSELTENRAPHSEVCSTFAAHSQMATTPRNLARPAGSRICGPR